MANNSPVVENSGEILGAYSHSERDQAGQLEQEKDEEALGVSTVLDVTKPSSFQRHNSLPANRIVRRHKRADGNVRVQSSLIPKRSNSINEGSRTTLRSQNTWETSQSLTTFSKQTSLTSLASSSNASNSSTSVFNRSSVFWSASLLYHTGIPTSVSRHLSCQLPPAEANMDSRRRINKAPSVDSVSNGSFRRRNEVQTPPRKKSSSGSSSTAAGADPTPAEPSTTSTSKRQSGLANLINRKGSLRRKESQQTSPSDLLEVSTEQEENGSTRCFGSGSSTPEPVLTPSSNSKLRDSFKRMKFRSKQQQRPEENKGFEAQSETKDLGSTSKIPRASSSSDVSSRVSSPTASYGRRTPEDVLVSASGTVAQPQRKSPKKVLSKLFKRSKASSSSNDKLEAVLAIAADPVNVPEDELPKQLKAKEESITRKFPDIVTFESEPKVLLPTERPEAFKNQSKYESKPYKSDTSLPVNMADANEEAGVVAETFKQVYKMQDEDKPSVAPSPDNDEGLPQEEEEVTEGVKETDLGNGEFHRINKLEDVVDRRYPSSENLHSHHHYVPHVLDVPLAGVGLLGPQSFIEHSVSELESGIGITPSSSLEDQLGKLATEEEDIGDEQVHGAVEDAAGIPNGNVLEKSISTTTESGSAGGGNDEAKAHKMTADVDVAEASETESDDEESTASSTESDLSTSLNLSKSLGLTEDETSYTESFKQLKPFQFEHHEPAPEGKRERLYKVLVVGELGTGKTSIIKRYVHQFFSQHYRATIGVDFALKVLRWDPETVVRLQLWDIAGQERFGSMTRVYYKEAVGAFVVFDVTRAATLEAVPKWKADLDAKVVLPDGRPIPTVLLANKCDQPKEGIAGNREKMNEFCQQQGFSAWFETSAKDNINIEDSANFLVSQILELDKWSQEPMSSDPDKLDLGANGKVKAGSSSNCAC